MPMLYFFFQWNCWFSTHIYRNAKVCIILGLKLIFSKRRLDTILSIHKIGTC
jgi:hypothetical protein